MKLDALLNAHAFMKVERPPELWEIDTDDDSGVILTLGEMIVAGLARGTDLSELTLNASNIAIEPDAGSEHLPTGEYVALTVRGSGTWADRTWWPGAAEYGPLDDLWAAAERGGWTYGWMRDLGDGGSVTLLYRRRR